MAVKVSPEKLKEAAKSVRSINLNLDSKLSSISKSVKDSEAEFQSDSGNELRAQMAALKPKFEQYKSVVESYAKFLETTIEVYELQESTLTSNASQLRQGQ